MAITFKKATKAKARLRMALCGPSGSGKTYSALKIGTALVDGGKILVLDTERGSASKYADVFEFDCFDEWDTVGGYNPEKLIEMIHEAGRQDFALVIIDSLSHFWFGSGGELDIVDKVAKRSQSGNSFTAWKEVTPIHNKLVATLLNSPMHVICTMRTKTEWVIEENERGKKQPRKIGTTPIMRDGIEFEFDVCGDMDQENNLIISKSRCPALARQVFGRPGADIAQLLAAWLSDGVDAPKPPPDPELAGKLRKNYADAKQRLFAATGSNDEYYRILGSNGFEHAVDLTGASPEKRKEVAAAMKQALADHEKGAA